MVAQTIFEEKDDADLGEMKNSILLLRLLFVRYSMMRLVVVFGKAAYHMQKDSIVVTLVLSASENVKYSPLAN